MDARSLSRIQSYFSRFAARNKISGYVASVTSKGTSLQFCGGNLSPDAGMPVNNDTLFEIGSLSKPITAAVIFSLYEKHKLDIDSPVVPYLAGEYEVDPVFEHIRIRDILVHLSGLPRIPHSLLLKMEGNEDPYAVISKQDIANYLESPVEITKPGKFNYSNFGYSLLAEIIKLITRKSFDEACWDNLFKDLGMTRTGTSGKFTNDENKAVGYTTSGKRSAYWTGPFLDGPGSILSTNRDMFVFLQHMMQVPGPAARGWQCKKGLIAKWLGYRDYYWHNGMTGGFSSYMAFNRKKNAGMCVLLNKACIPDPLFYYFSSFAR